MADCTLEDLDSSRDRTLAIYSVLWSGFFPSVSGKSDSTPKNRNLGTIVKPTTRQRCGALLGELRRKLGTSLKFGVMVAS